MYFAAKLNPWWFSYPQLEILRQLYPILLAALLTAAHLTRLNLSEFRFGGRQTAGLILQVVFKAFKTTLIKDLSLVFVIFFLLSIVLIPLFLQPVDSELKMFIAELRQSYALTDFRGIAHKVAGFIDTHVRNSYMKPESVFELDNHLSLLDNRLLKKFGFSRAHVIVFQGWGSCGQYAEVAWYIFSSLGLEARQVKFRERDHRWAEVRLNGTWYIFDPWYIGLHYNDKYMVPASELAKIPRFSGSYTVVEIRPEGTEVDVSLEHGYTRGGFGVIRTVVDLATG
ncbi:transglutaminase domain-containing protein [Infirmifilum lucidum]|uniref:Transglutaminase domain-containing protein n=1 Tax=Infirmifilum lucidum TaxID=2776706 RepID=A0A7L9FI31_9CREN|nr:transglutaminase domain-containing protein [Infirmifilum lucidum]QOJ79022.1 transglutaminase domain-containing protein [Infirmifilum lucidum]